MKQFKNYISILVLLLTCGLSFGQQLEQYTLSTFNYFAVNPAVAGSRQCLDVRLGYRAQWVGLEGSPRTAFINAHGKMATSRTGVVHGLGMQIVSDQAGPYAFTKMQASYAINLKMNKTTKFALGTNVGLQQHRLDLGNVLAQVGVADDPLLRASDALFVYPIVDLGAILYNRNRFFGASLKNVTQVGLRKTENNGIGQDAQLARHIYLSAGTSIDLGNNLYFKPSVHMRKTAGSPIAIDANLVVDYNNAFAVGLVARNQNGFSALLRITAFDYVSFGYAYDYTVSRIKVVGQNSHEIVIGIQACPKDPKQDIPCAAYY